MKTLCVNLFKRWRYIKALLTAKSFILLVHNRPKNGRPGNQVHTCMPQDEYLASILREAGTHIDQACKATESLTNTLGIKGSGDN